MPRKRPESRGSKIAKMLIEEYKPQNAQDIQEALKDLLGDTMEELLKSELDEHLDYEYGEKPLSLNTRNGSSKKTVRSSYVDIDLNIPRDREATIETIKALHDEGYKMAVASSNSFFSSRSSSKKNRNIRLLYRIFHTRFNKSKENASRILEKYCKSFEN
ncbi:transposase [Anaerococcus sp.]|uniref:transposase n=1 Tax=Anaerococcus sp. TaxID=1872515 RepID=UPI0027B9A9DA|nr:transposase [Anaerococcus sp.]